MTYAVGETVVYPNHGAALVEGIETRKVNGEDHTYLVLRIAAQNGLEVRVPACNLDVVGVRDLVDEKGLQQVLEVLRAEPTDEPSNWSRRHRVNTEKLRTGSAIRVAEVVRDLGRRRRAGHLSAAEENTLSKAHRILVSELTHCGRAFADQAQRLLDDVLAC
jgi:CarD family transcriptional regulator